LAVDHPDTPAEADAAAPAPPSARAAAPPPTLAYLQALGEAPALRPTPADAFAAARDQLRRGERLDMVALAAKLGVARGTLYRWAGDRDRLLADVISAELGDLIMAAIARAPGTGVSRLEHAIGWFLEIVAGAPALRALLANEGGSGLRMITSPAGRVRPRLVATVAKLIEQEVAEGRYRPPAQPELLADGIIALAERYLHNGGDPTLNPDPRTATAIVSLLLREPCA
jgi:AcrR family transcriptional regulator